MANYICTFRTNYFKVKDDKKFEEFMTHVYAEDLELFHMTDKNGNKLYGFGGYGSISGYFNSKEDYVDNDEAWDNAYDNFIDGLAMQGYEYRNITDVGVEMAKQMLNNPDYTTRCDY